MVMKQKFIVNGQQKEVQVRADDSLLKTALRGRLPLNHSCGGMGTCGTCRVIVCEGLDVLGAPNDVEAEIIQDRGFSVNERLACQNSPREGLVVEIPLGAKLKL